MAQQFSFGNSVLHFARSDGPGGFLWKYLASYLAVAVCLTALSYALFQPLFGIWFSILVEAMGGASDAEIEAILARRAVEIVGWIVFGYLLMLILGVMFWAVFEAAAQRRLVRDEGFSLRIGGDEFRLILVGLIWVGLGLAAQIFSIIFIAISTASLVYALDNPGGGAIAVLLCMALLTGLWIWIGVRLAPASAMTVRDGRVTFFDAWNVTRGRFWTLLGSYLVLAIIVVTMATLTWYFIGTGVAAAIMANIERFQTAIDAENPLMLLSALMQFDILAPIIGGWMFWVMVQGPITFMWAGPAALAAKTDPRGGGVAQAPDVFA